MVHVDDRDPVSSEFDRRRLLRAGGVLSLGAPLAACDRGSPGPARPVRAGPPRLCRPPGRAAGPGVPGGATAGVHPGTAGGRRSCGSATRWASTPASPAPSPARAGTPVPDADRAPAPEGATRGNHRADHPAVLPRRRLRRRVQRRGEPYRQHPGRDTRTTPGHPQRHEPVLRRHRADAAGVRPERLAGGAHPRRPLRREAVTVGPLRRPAAAGRPASGAARCARPRCARPRASGSR
jgi:hypothetical protein